MASWGVISGTHRLQVFTELKGTGGTLQVSTRSGAEQPGNCSLEKKS